jgi:hypothetical protein
VFLSDILPFTARIISAIKQYCFVSLVLAGALCTATFGQSLPAPTADNAMGDQPYMSYHGGDIDSVNLTNGMLSVKFPFLSYPQRGELHLSFDLMYNNQPQHYAQHCIPHASCYYQWGYFPFQNPLPLEKGDAFVGLGATSRCGWSVLGGDDWNNLVRVLLQLLTAIGRWK